MNAITMYVCFMQVKGRTWALHSSIPRIQKKKKWSSHCCVGAYSRPQSHVVLSGGEPTLFERYYCSVLFDCASYTGTGDGNLLWAPWTPPPTRRILDVPPLRGANQQLTDTQPSRGLQTTTMMQGLPAPHLNL